MNFTINVCITDQIVEELSEMYCEDKDYIIEKLHEYFEECTMDPDLILDNLCHFL